MSFLDQEFESLHRAKTPLELQREADKLARKMGFDAFAYLLNVSELPPSFEPVLLDTYPRKWVERYREGNYAETDPLIGRARHTARPLVWADYQKPSQSDSVLEFWEEAQAFGLADGVSLPIHGRPAVTGVFSLCRDQSLNLCADEWFRLIGEVHSFAATLHELVCQLKFSNLLALQEVQLTWQQRTVMQWVAAGKTAEEIGHIMNMSRHGVVFHINKAKALLAATNTAQAVARATLLGLL